MTQLDRWRPVPMRELHEIWATQEKRRILFNGCTNAELIRRYGSNNVRHVYGTGWFTRACQFKPL